MTTLGLILWAIVSSASGIYNYVIRGEAELLIYGPAFIYIAVISTICFSLWALHYRNWDRTGRRSEILRLEAKAAAFDGILTIVAGGGIVAVYLFGDGLLAPVAPIADSIILLVLCLLIIRHFWIDFTMGLAELAGATANASTLQTARIACRPVLNAFDGKVRDFVVLKYGRSYDVVCYLHPKNPISAAEVDEISNNLTTALQDRLPGAHVNILISRRGRAG
jgi:divalent metal cation (Fe/Co/Zn/Cd) transporter